MTPRIYSSPGSPLDGCELGIFDGRDFAICTHGVWHPLAVECAPGCCDCCKLDLLDRFAEVMGLEPETK